MRRRAMLPVAALAAATLTGSGAVANTSHDGWPRINACC